MPRRYHRAPEFRREHAYVLLFLPACTLVTCVSLALADIYRVPGLARACTVHSCVTREGFRLRVNLQKMRVHGCAHTIRAILNASTMLASIKFKSSCTVVFLLFIATYVDIEGGSNLFWVPNSNLVYKHLLANYYAYAVLMLVIAFIQVYDPYYCKGSSVNVETIMFTYIFNSYSALLKNGLYSYVSS